MKFFDAACWIGRWPGEKLAYDDVSGLTQAMDRLGIERALVSHTIAWQNSASLGNKLLMQAIAGNPRLLPSWVVTPGPELEANGGIETLLADLSRQRVRAIRLFPRDHVYPLTDWGTGDLLQALNERRYIVQLDLDQVFTQVGMYDYDANGLRYLQWLCQSFPNLAVILSRLGYRAYQNLVALMAICPNLYLDTSYFATHTGIEDVVRRFGAERVVFATAQPLVDPGGSMVRCQLSGVNHHDLALISSENIERLFGRVVIDSAPEEHDEPAVISQSEDQIGHLSPLLQEQNDRIEPQVEITDAHGHLGPYHKFHIPDSGADGLMRVMDRCGISRLALSSHLAISADWKLGNELTAAAVSKFPDRLIGQVVVSPNEPDQMRSELVHYFDDLGFRAIKVVPDTHQHPIGGKGYEPAWEFAAERRCLLLCHTFHGSNFDSPPLFDELAARYPEVPILMVHSGALTAAFEGAIAVAKKHPNLYLDVSGSYITGEWIRRFVRQVGADRVVFSSDVPFIDVRYSLGRVLFAQLDDQELAMVLGSNIRRLLNLSTN